MWVRKRLVKFLSLLNLVYQEPSLVDHTPCILPYINISTRRVKHSEDNRSLHLELFHTLPSVSLLLANFDLYPFPEGKCNSEYIYTWVYTHTHTHTHTHMLCPMSESPSGKREGLQDNATRRKGSLLLTRARASAATNPVVQGQRAPSPSCYTNL